MLMRAWPERNPADQAAFAATIQEALGRHDISAVVCRDVKLRRAGRGMKALCPFHSERTPSFYVYDGGANFHCYGCGANGDTIDYIVETRRISFTEALRWLGASDLPVTSPAERAERKKADDAARLQDIADARDFWSRCIRPEGTPAEVYARSRGITMQLPASVRFGNLPPWRDQETMEWADPRPAMVCGVYDRGGEIAGIQRVYLRDGGLAKARMRKPKLTLGRIRGGSMRLGPVQPRVIVCEGPEDGLSLAQEIPGASVWPTLGTGLMPLVDYPDEVREIVVAGQNDDAGRNAAFAAAEALVARGYMVSTMFPASDYKDWNDELCGVRR
jgi:DNA primase